MHIVDGALSNPVVLGGVVLSLGGVAMGLRQMTLEKTPVAGVLSASFFVASLIHVSVGPSSVHLILNGLIGLILGWSAFPVLFVGLLLQAVFFGFGGVTVLGINTLNIALPAVVFGLLLRPMIARGTPSRAALWGAFAGGLSIAGTVGLVALSLALSGQAFVSAAKIVLVVHVPVILIEAVLTGTAVHLVMRVKPELFSDQGSFS